MRFFSAARREGISMSAMSEIVLRDPELKANPYPVFSRLRRDSPVCRARGVTRSFWLVTRYDDVVLVLKDNRFAANRKNAPAPGRGMLEKIVFRIYGPLLTNMLDTDDPDHARLRGLVHRHLRCAAWSSCVDVLKNSPTRIWIAW